MDIIAQNAAAYGKTCIGCIRNKRDVMISAMTSDTKFFDIFLTQEQAIMLRDDLAARIAYNEKCEDEDE